jgi:hypothetical protein
MSRNTMIVLMYRRHKLTDLTSKTVENIDFCKEQSNGKNILHKDKKM